MHVYVWLKPRSPEEWEEYLLEMVTAPGKETESPGYYWAELTRLIRLSGHDLRIAADFAEKLVKKHFPEFTRCK